MGCQSVLYHSPCTLLEPVDGDGQEAQATGIYDALVKSAKEHTAQHGIVRKVGFEIRPAAPAPGESAAGSPAAAAAHNIAYTYGMGRRELPSGIWVSGVSVALSNWTGRPSSQPTVFWTAQMGHSASWRGSKAVHPGR